jgi:hypothetical protein
MVIMVIMVVRYKLRRTLERFVSEATDTSTFVTMPEGRKYSALGPPVCSLFSVRPFCVALQMASQIRSSVVRAVQGTRFSFCMFSPAQMSISRFWSPD